MEVCREYPEIAAFVGRHHCNNFEAIQSNDGEGQKGALKRFFTELMNKAQTGGPEYEGMLSSVETIIRKKGDGATNEETLFLEARAMYGADTGLITILILNYITLSAGEAIFIEPGIPHAYAKGNLIECMANSDNVIRAGLTSKFIDVNNLVNTLTYESGKVEKVSVEKTGGIT